MLIYIYTGFHHLCVRGALSCWFGDRGQSGFHHLYDLRFQKSFGENFSFQGHSRSNLQNSMKFMFIGPFQLILRLDLRYLVGM